MVVKTIAGAAVLTGGLIAVLIFPVGKASAFCDSVDCVPNVARNVVPGAPCDPQPLFDFGLDSSSKALVCTTDGVWVAVGPLVGVREVTLACDAMNQSAQTPAGAPLWCAQVNRTLRWIHRVDVPS
jgi:hypothetical protein